MGYVRTPGVCKPGVYCITNTVNGKRYVGSSTQSIRARWNFHISQLRRSVHGSRYLQRAWNKYGEEAFEFAILVLCDKDACLDQEQRFLDLFQSSLRKHGYNLLPIAGSPRGFKHTAAAKEKVAASKRGIPRSDATKQLLSQSRRGLRNSPETIAKIVAKNTGAQRTPEQCLRISQSLKGKPKSEAAKLAMSKCRIGVPTHPCSEEKKLAISNANTGKKRTPQQRENIRQGRILAKARRAALSSTLDCHRQT